MELFTRDNGRRMVLGTDEESNFGLMDQNMRAGGKMTWQMAKDDLFTPMVMFTLAIGLTIKLMVMETILIWMVPNTKENGKKINSTDMELKHGQTVLAIKASTNMAKSMGEESLIGLMVQNTMANFSTTTFMVKELIYGLTCENTQVTG